MISWRNREASRIHQRHSLINSILSSRLHFRPKILDMAPILSVSSYLRKTINLGLPGGGSSTAQEKHAWRTALAEPDAAYPRLSLLNLQHAPPGSALRQLAHIFLHLENLSHILVCANRVQQLLLGLVLGVPADREASVKKLFAAIATRSVFDTPGNPPFGGCSSSSRSIGSA